MQGLIEKLYHGELSPAEKALTNDLRYRQMGRKASDAMMTWKERHSEEEFEELEALLDIYAQIHGMELTSSFRCGFRLGACLMVEVLGERDGTC